MASMGQTGSHWGALERILVATVVLVALAAIALIICFTLLGDRGPLYSAAIDSVTGLDSGDLGRQSSNGDLNPLFNLTLRVTSRSIFSGDCTVPGAVVEVSYADVLLAAGPVQRFCTKQREAKELQAVAAWGTAVRVPGFALDDLAVTMPATHGSGHHGRMVSCRGLRVGDTASLGAPCTASDVDTVVSLPRPSGKVDGGGAN